MENMREREGQMENYQLGREVLDVADFDEEHFSMCTWGNVTSCGSVACLAGTALLKSGYHLAYDSTWFTPDGDELADYLVGSQAAALLGMTPDEVGRPAYDVNLCLLKTEIWHDIDHGVKRFRAIVEKAEKENGGR